MSSTDQPGISVQIEIAPGYRPPSRVAAAITELSDALAEAADTDVEGFQLFDKPFGVIVYRPLPDLAKSLCNNEVIEGVFKF